MESKSPNRDGKSRAVLAGGSRNNHPQRHNYVDQIFNRPKYGLKLITVSYADKGIVEINMLTRIDIDDHAVEGQRKREANDHREIVDEETPSIDQSLVKAQKSPLDRSKSNQIQSSCIQTVVESHLECTESIRIDGDVAGVGKEQNDGQLDSEQKQVTREQRENVDDEVFEK